jgi:hypothetical protein
MFDMSNDSKQFATKAKLESVGGILNGNTFLADNTTYVPLLEAKMLHQFDHRFSTYKGATQKHLNVGILPQPSLEEKADAAFTVQPRYWVTAADLEEASPRFPEIVANALKKNRIALRQTLTLWAAGFLFNRGRGDEAVSLLKTVKWSRTRRGADVPSEIKELSASLERDFTIDNERFAAIQNSIDEPEAIASALLDQFTTKWLLGWRDVTNAGNERTLLMSALPHVAVGNNFPLLFLSTIPPAKRLCLMWMANSFVLDYVCRQKIGGTHINYFYLKQLPFLDPTNLDEKLFCAENETLVSWVLPRVLELTLVADDILALADDFGIPRVAFDWNEDRRFEITCELDAAAFHVYLPSNDDGSWLRQDGESAKELTRLSQDFAKPRNAVAHIFECFPIVRRDDEARFNCYRTKERVLTIYDRMLEAQRTRTGFASSLDPAPGVYRQVVETSPA